MAALKTQKTQASVDAFLDGIEDDTKRADCRTLRALMEEITDAPATMWGKAIVGFGAYHYTYASGRDGDWFEVGFSPRKQNLTLYIMPGFAAYDDLMGRLGKHKTGKSCLYVKKLADLDMDALRTLITESVEDIRARHPA